jgi:hypothetical protein
MRTGLLWFDDEPSRSLEDKVLRAAAHYERKYGQAPDLCFVHPSAFDGNGRRPAKKAGEVEIRPGRSVLRDHFWLGVAETHDGVGRSQRSPVAEGQQPTTPGRARQLAMVLEDPMPTE